MWGRRVLCGKQQVIGCVMCLERGVGVGVGLVLVFTVSTDL